jgi:hypothetical protein
MSITQIFAGLPPFLKDRFCSEVITLGLINELNEQRFRARCRRLIRQHNGETRKLYKALNNLTSDNRLHFFDIVSGHD